MAGVAPGVTAIPLGRPSPGASSNQPERQGQRMRPRSSPKAQAHRSYSVLLPAGLAVPPTLPPARCALAAPFHTYPQAKRPCGPLAGGGLLSVALSLGSPPPDVIRRRIRVEPGLSSAPSTRSGGGGRPADWLGWTYEREVAMVKEKRGASIVSLSGGEIGRAPKGRIGVVHCSFTRFMGLCRPGGRLACLRGAGCGLGATLIALRITDGRSFP